MTARLSGTKARRGALMRWSLIAAGAAVAILAIGRAFLAPGGTNLPALAYRVEGGSVIDGGYLREWGGAGMKLFFTGGTEFVLMPGSRGRIRTLDDSGARIAIEHGTASFEVVPHAGRKWLVDVGPFLVTVKGTAFTVSWDVATERFELQLRHGRVTVSGPISGGDITLLAGHRLIVDLPNAETMITALKPEEARSDAVPSPQFVSPALVGRAPVVPPTRAPGPPGERPSSPASSERPGVPGLTTGVVLGARESRRHWAEALAAGRLGEILGDVERAGLKKTLEGASNEELFALADAARYRRRMELAREALLAARRRFPASTRSLDAAFLLGRVEESIEHGTAKALRWYEEYLARAPEGTYAAEALGREMILTRDMGGASQAAPMAEEYLRRFPTGTYAGTARALRHVP
ncbi:MAG TPA: hypothetical protein VGP07_24275 [Polyangia bacterium]